MAEIDLNAVNVTAAFPKAGTGVRQVGDPISIEISQRPTGRSRRTGWQSPRFFRCKALPGETQTTGKQNEKPRASEETQRTICQLVIHCGQNLIVSSATAERLPVEASRSGAALPRGPL